MNTIYILVYVYNRSVKQKKKQSNCPNIELISTEEVHIVLLLWDGGSNIHINVKRKENLFQVTDSLMILIGALLALTGKQSLLLALRTACKIMPHNLLRINCNMQNHGSQKEKILE